MDYMSDSGSESKKVCTQDTNQISVICRLDLGSETYFQDDLFIWLMAGGFSSSQHSLLHRVA